MKSKKLLLSLLNIVILIVLIIGAELMIACTDKLLITKFIFGAKLIVISCFGFFLGLFFSKEYLFRLLNKQEKSRYGTI